MKGSNSVVWIFNELWYICIKADTLYTLTKKFVKEYRIWFVLFQSSKFLPFKINGLNHSIPDRLIPSHQSQPSFVLVPLSPPTSTPSSQSRLRDNVHRRESLGLSQEAWGQIRALPLSVRLSLDELFFSQGLSFFFCTMRFVWVNICIALRPESGT